MIASAYPLPRGSVPDWHQPLLTMLPKIGDYAHGAFAALDPEARAEAVAEVIANATVAFARLAARGKAHLAYPTVLAYYAIWQTREGRQVGGHLRVGEVLSAYAQRRKGFVVERLDRYDRETDEWVEAVVEDDRTPVADQVAFRIDFPAWLRRLGRRTRRIAVALALGHSTGQVARRFKLSEARISQLRRELYRSWRNYHGEAAAAV